jgi:predicted dithiol-disulfide oxidoreductase (DUF899 family)
MVALAKSAPQSRQHIHFPNESPQYRRARNVLLEHEMELRRQIERVAAQRGRCRREAQFRRTMFSRRLALAAGRSA